MPLARLGRAGALLACVLLVVSPRAAHQSPRLTPQPPRALASLSDAQFWALIERVSEPDGFFRSNSGSPDNLLSNERTLSVVAAGLSQRVKPGGIYLGVGPEQNFTYIAAMRPHLAFIVDIRRGNLQLHLLYKALFEMSSSRAEFVGRLFSRTQTPEVKAASTIVELMRAYLRADAVDEAAFRSNLDAILDHLTRTRGLPLDAADRDGIEYVYRAFHRFGPAIHYTASIGRSRSAATYAELMTAGDGTGVPRSYLATDAHFAFVKAMQRKNLIVPVVGDFAGPKALRAIGEFLNEHGVTASAFYVSNVEMYLQRNGVWQAFCANVAALPLDADSIFIRPDHGRSRTFAPMVADTAACRR